jgi:hypothetical protein
VAKVGRRDVLGAGQENKKQNQTQQLTQMPRDRSVRATQTSSIECRA